MTAWQEYLGAILGLLLALEIGARLAQRRKPPLTAERRSDLNVILSALLAVLGFLVAFSFSIAESRFAARKALVYEEANAIGTTYLRADFLPEGARERSRQLLRAYVDLRLSAEVETLDDVVVGSEEVHDQLWAIAAEVANQRPDSEAIALYVSSLNQTIDLHEERLSVAIRHRLPTVFLVLLGVSALLSMGLLGFTTGERDRRSVAGPVILILVLGSLLMSVRELDRPDSRIFRVGQGAMQDLQRAVRPRGP